MFALKFGAPHLDFQNKEANLIGEYSTSSFKTQTGGTRSDHRRDVYRKIRKGKLGKSSTTKSALFEGICMDILGSMRVFLVVTYCSYCSSKCQSQ